MNLRAVKTVVTQRLYTDSL